MITRAKISAVRASGVRRLLTFLSQMRRLFEGDAYSSKYGSRHRGNTFFGARYSIFAGQRYTLAKLQNAGRF